MTEQWTIEEVAEFLGAASNKSASRTLSRWGITRVDTEEREHGRVASLFDADQVRAAKTRPRARGGRPSRASLISKEARAAGADRVTVDTQVGHDQHAVTAWLDAHRDDLLALGDLLVDHREHLLGLLPQEAQQQLAEAIDRAGELLASRPRVGLAGAIAYAVYLLRPDGPATASGDLVVREGIARGLRLRDSFEQVHLRT